MNWRNIKKRTVINSCIIALLCVTLFVCALMTTRGKTPEERTNFTSDTECSVDAEETSETTTALPETTTSLPETTTKAPAETKKDAAVKAVNAKSEIAEEKKEYLTEREFTVRNIFVSAANSSISDTKLKYMRTVLEGLPEQFFSWNVKCIKIVDGIPGYGKNCRGLSVYTENTIYLNSNTPNNDIDISDVDNLEDVEIGEQGIDVESSQTATDAMSDIAAEESMEIEDIIAALL